MSLPTIDSATDQITGLPARARWLDRLQAWWMLAPVLAFTLVFALYPVIESFLLSLQRVFLAVPSLGQQWVGLDNFRLLVQDPVVRQALGVTLSSLSAISSRRPRKISSSSSPTSLRPSINEASLIG